MTASSWNRPSAATAARLTSGAASFVPVMVIRMAGARCGITRAEEAAESAHHVGVYPRGGSRAASVTRPKYLVPTESMTDSAPAGA
ncbi:hypothetical protein Shyhy01_72830 [Streptomyces hygroscopicus subsp. hygroscopicus]|nr:hypothetical protein Shyhy01_72830 [Streptomyces hygroscopicus subsp. hygroscopicus]